LFRSLPLKISELSLLKLPVMDIFATFFGLSLLALGVGVTYRWGIKPDREEKKRRAEQIRAELRRQHYESLRRGAALRSGSITHHS
jgi:hypothetical protein